MADQLHGRKLSRARAGAARGGGGSRQDRLHAAFQRRYYSHPVRVYLHRVGTHDGTRYFCRMRWALRPPAYYWRVRGGNFVNG